MLEAPRRGGETELIGLLSVAIALSNSLYLSIVARNRLPGEPDCVLVALCLVFSTEDSESKPRLAQAGSDKDRRSGVGGDDRKFRDIVLLAPIPGP